MDKKKKVALHNLGCKVNAYETEAMAKLFEESGYELVPFDTKADIYIINTCTVTSIADRKSRQMLHKAKKMNEDALVVAVGCYAQTFTEDLKKDAAIDIIVGNDRKKEIVNIVENHIAVDVMDINNRTDGNNFEELNIETMEEHTRAYMKIQDGCNQFCSYCIIPFSRGRIRSRIPENIYKEVKRLTDKGYKEVVFTGIHLSSYGLDFKEENAPKLIDVIEKSAENKAVKRLRLGSLEPRIVTEDFLRRLTKIECFCPHFHLSLQSGCDNTLKRMNRKYTAEEYMEGCRLIRKYFPDAAITTDVIVGFPGETEEDFEVCRKFVNDVNFAQMHIFKYSMRKGTNAAKMTDQVDDNIKAKRSDILLADEQRMRKAYMDRYLNKDIQVLFEEIVNIKDKKYFIGHTKEYVRVGIPWSDEKDTSLENQLVTVKAVGYINDEMMLGENE